MFLFFALIGLINVCSLWPIIIIWDLLEIEQFEWPNSNVLFLLTINGLVSVFSDYFWAQAILLTSPVVATVGLSLMMPMAMIADEIFRGETHSLLYWVGALFVTIGFICVNWDFKKKEEENQSNDDNEEAINLKG